MKAPGEDPNRELYERFRQDLKRPVGERYYSEDELICIFDTAGDNGDEYARTEALLLGARLYPDSRELLERRAILYRDHDFSNYSSFEDFLEDNPSVSTPLWEILKLSCLRGSREEIKKHLDGFIADKHFDSDEEVIQFIQAIHHLHLDDWSYDHIDLLKSKVDYLPTLLFEIAVAADLDSEIDIEIKMLEELTEMDPFGADYWAMLAGAYIQADRPDDATNAADLALAINPQHPEALKMKVKLTAPDDPGYKSLVEKAVAASGKEEHFIYYLLNAAGERNDFSEIHYLLEHILEKCNVYSEAVESAIESDYPRLDELLVKFYDCGNDTREDWKHIADVAYSCNRPGIVTMILMTYEQKSGKSLDYSLLLQLMLFRMKQYELAVNTFFSTSTEDTVRNPGHMFRGYAIMILSLLRLGRIEEALSGARTMLDSLDEGGLQMSSFEAFGMRIFLLDIIKRIETGDETDWENYDPTAIAAGPV